MCFEWNKQSIEWFLDASIYTEFHKELGQHIIPFLDPEDSICDFGCGLGRLLR
jgi:2-polyprenyl-3-methyl-5-hydroxy-6-metoxy-1,4-benzoquinol methylase